MNKRNSFGANRAPVEGIFVKMKTSHSRENKGYFRTHVQLLQRYSSLSG